MWNTFDSCKLKLKENYKDVRFAAEMESQELKAKAQEIFASDDSVSSRKSKAIVLLLNNAGVQIPNDESIFAYKIKHEDLLFEFHYKNKADVMSGEAKEKVRGLEDTNTFRADMDFGHVAPDWAYLLSKGVLGVAEDLEKLKTDDKKIIHYAGIDKWQDDWLVLKYKHTPLITLLQRKNNA